MARTTVVVLVLVFDLASSLTCMHQPVIVMRDDNEVANFSILGEFIECNGFGASQRILN